jgi:hypothetical protein
VRASRRMRTSECVPSCFETPSQRAAAVEGPAPGSRCDAPQHEVEQWCAYAWNVIQSSQDYDMQHVSILAGRLGSIVAIGAKPYDLGRDGDSR